MRKLLISFTLTFITLVSFSQVSKFRTSSFQMKTKTDYGWSKWSEAKENNILIVFDFDKERVTIFSKETQVYDIYQTYEKVTDQDGDYIFEFACVDAEGLKCHIRWVKLNSQNGRLQIYVDFSDIMWMYNVNMLD